VLYALVKDHICVFHLPTGGVTVTKIPGIQFLGLRPSAGADPQSFITGAPVLSRALSPKGGAQGAGGDALLVDLGLDEGKPFEVVAVVRDIGILGDKLRLQSWPSTNLSEAPKLSAHLEHTKTCFLAIPPKGHGTTFFVTSGMETFLIDTSDNSRISLRYNPLLTWALLFLCLWGGTRAVRLLSSLLEPSLIVAACVQSCK
jgi:hypothetical protein